MRIWSLSLRQQCDFRLTKVCDCGVSSCPDRIAIRTVRISIIKDWPTVEFVQVLCEIDNWYWLLVLATGPGIPPAVRVGTAKPGRSGSRPVPKPNPQTLGGPIPDPYLSTRGFCRVWLDPSVPISGSAFRVSHLESHSDMLLLIIKY
jgi:hypothetical protein